MNFKLVSKNNLGGVMVLIIVILLSQSRMLDFLMNTPLGRIALLSVIVFVAHINKILGLVAVLFVIIAFNNNGMNTVYGYNSYEGFDSSGNTTANTIMKDKLLILQAKEDILKNKIAAIQQKTSDSSTIATTSSSASGTETFGGREGFCLTDKESNMLRGKQSNSVPVFNNLREQSDDVSPSDKSVFSSDYATI